MRLRSVRARLTLYYTLALAAIMLLFSVVVFLLVRANLSRQMDLQLSRDLSIARGISGHDPEDVSEIQRQGGVDLFRVQSGQRVLISTRGWQLAGLDAAGGSSNHRDSAWIWESPRHRVYYLKTAKVSMRNEEGERKWPPVVLVTVARDGYLIQRSLGSLAAIVLICFAFAVGLAVVGGYLMAGRVLSPIGAMASKAQAITAERLAERLPVHNPEDELGRLATAFNSTLARLQDSFDRLRRFTSDASHELRTPLTAIKSVGEVAMRDGNDASAHREAISSMLEEADRLARLADSLLTLTRADAGTTRLSRESTDLGALTTEVVECLKVLADEKGLSISVEADDGVRADVDRSTIRQAVMNLLDNAIKYTPKGGGVSVAVKRDGAQAAIEVRDTGPGIPEEHRGRVFDRFYRVEKARSGTRGAGLGLAIAKWAVEANGGTIELEKADSAGSIFKIVLADGRPNGTKAG